MIDSQFGEMLGEDPEHFFFNELTPFGVGLFPLPSAQTERGRIFFDADASQEEMPAQRKGPGNAYAQAESGNRPKRVNNTIFKTSLSEYRKSLIDEVKSNVILGWLPGILKQVYGATKNMSIFPKINFMVRQLGIEQSINQRWSVRSKQLLAKKQHLMNKGKFKESRLQQLRQDVIMMNKCLGEPEFEVAFKRYWGDYRQETKHQLCKDDVDAFREEFKKKAIWHKENPIAVPPTRRKRKGKSSLLGRGAKEIEESEMREERMSSTQC